MRTPHISRQRGFSLVEILIGMLIAMIGVVIMMEVLLTSDQRTRTTTTGNDALSSGAVMMHMMQRDLVQAGYGINSMSLLGCNLTLPNAKVIPLAPVVINPAVALVAAGDPNTETMLIFYSSDNGQPEGNIVYAVDGLEYTMQAPSAFAVDDYVIASPGGCPTALSLARVTAVSALAVTVDTALAGATVLHNVGKVNNPPRIVAYRVKDNSLQACNYMTADCSSNGAANWSAVAGDIVSLRAQYGHDTTAAMDGAIDDWDVRAPAAAVNASCSWARTPAVRFALVARSSQYESRINTGTGQRECDTVTGAAPGWNGATDAIAPIDAASAAPIDLTKKPDGTANADWQCYRYRTFENIAPTRNVVWMGAQAGC